MQNFRNSAATVTLCPQVSLSSPFTPLAKHRVFHSISISLMFRTFRPFSSLQTAPPQPPEPMKYPLAISLTVPAHSPLSCSHVQPLHLSLQLMARGIHQHLVCSVKTAAHRGSNWQTLSGVIEPTITHPHCTLFSALFGAISSLVHICMQLKRCSIFYGCEFQELEIH